MNHILEALTVFRPILHLLPFFSFGTEGGRIHSEKYLTVAFFSL